MNAPLLQVDGVTRRFQGLVAVNAVSFSVAAGEILSLIGPNGAGKSTLLRAIAGLIPKMAGTVCLAGEDVSGLPGHTIVRRGVAFVAEGGRLFPFMSVQDNLELGADKPGVRSRRKQAMEEVMDIFPILRERRTQLAGRLSGGERQMCAIARAVMGSPRLLMLDEPSPGLAPIVVERVFELVRMLVRSKDLTVLLVEQNVADALELCHHAYILERGRIAKSGLGSALADDPDVQRAYMGL